MQTTHLEQPNAAHPGQPRGEYKAIHRANTHSAAIAPGLGLTEDTAVTIGAGNSGGAELPDAAADITVRFLGVSKYDYGVEPNSSGDMEYAVGDEMGIVHNGLIPVVTEDTPAWGAPAYCRHTASGGNTQLGAFRDDDDTTTAALVPYGARFEGNQGLASGYYWLRLNG